MAGAGVPAAPDREFDSPVAGRVDGPLHIAGGLDPHDDARPLVGAVTDNRASLIVVRVGREDQPTVELVAEGFDGAFDTVGGHYDFRSSFGYMTKTSERGRIRHAAKEKLGRALFLQWLRA